MDKIGQVTTDIKYFKLMYLIKPILKNVIMTELESSDVLDTQYTFDREVKMYQL